MAPLIHELKKREEICCTVCVSAQHREMLDRTLAVFGITPDYDLDIMEKDQSLSHITTKVLNGVDRVIKQAAPHILLVHGDTSTAFAAALSAFYNRVPLGHVEAGLRTNDRYSPYPEEINRRFISSVSEMDFAPTEKSRDNLILEGKDPESIFVTGNTVVDALNYTVKESYSDEILDWAAGSRLIILTAHRRESMGDTMQGMLRACAEVCSSYEDTKILFPVHPNPRLLEAVHGIFNHNERILLTEPLEADRFHNIMKRACVILTDSGGIQEEATALSKPVLVLRNTTERPEGIDAGTLTVAGTDENNIKKALVSFLEGDDLSEKAKNAKNPYGDGCASVRIADAIIERFNRP